MLFNVDMRLQGGNGVSSTVTTDAVITWWQVKTCRFQTYLTNNIIVGAVLRVAVGLKVDVSASPPPRPSASLGRKPLLLGPAGCQPSLS